MNGIWLLIKHWCFEWRHKHDVWLESLDARPPLPIFQHFLDEQLGIQPAPWIAPFFVIRNQTRKQGPLLTSWNHALSYVFGTHFLLNLVGNQSTCFVRFLGLIACSFDSTEPKKQSFFKGLISRNMLYMHFRAHFLFILVGNQKGLIVSASQARLGPLLFFAFAG